MSVPAWNPWNPVDYFGFIEFWWRYKGNEVTDTSEALIKLDWRRRIEIESRISRFLPWFLLVFTFLTQVIYNIVIDAILFTHPDVHLYESSIRTRMGLLNNTTIASNVSAGNITGVATLADHLHANHRYPLLTMLIGLALIAGVVVATGTSLAKGYRGLPRILASFIVSSLLQSKILFWMNDKLILISFFICRVAETGLVLSVASQLVVECGHTLPSFSTTIAAALSLVVAVLTRLSVGELMWVSGCLAPLYLFSMASLYFAVPKHDPRFLHRNIGVLVMGISPFCIAAFSSWLYHWSHFFGPTETVPSFHNLLVVISSGLIVNQVLYWTSKFSSPEMATKARSLGLWFCCLALPVAQVAADLTGLSV